jgi:phosphoribosylformimino-5-aminoimidazole carboxamide ribotide isomerase
VDLYPAIDIRGGRCVRLVEGDFSRETVYGDDPVQVAVGLASAGARWIHVVDLDAARSGAPVNRETVARVAAAAAARGVQVQAGGGVRTLGDAAGLIAAGVERVVMGTASLETPEVVGEAADRWPGRVAAGLDHRGGQLRTRGWTEGSGRRLEEVVAEVMAAGAAAVVVTDIGRDGTMQGPDVDGLSELLEATGAPIIASGGVGGLEDVRLLASVRSSRGEGFVGVIAGKAIYEGRLAVAAAVECAAGRAAGGAGRPGPR